MSCVMSAYLYGLETAALTERQQQRLQVCENTWVRRIVGVKRVDRRRMDELREEIGVQMSLMGRLVKFQLRRAGHLMWMRKERMPKRADRLREQGKRKRGRLWLRWEDCVRRDINKVGMVGEWRELAEDRGRWRSIIWSKQGKSLVPLDLTPYGGRRGEQHVFYSLQVYYSI